MENKQETLEQQQQLQGTATMAGKNSYRSE